MVVKFANAVQMATLGAKDAQASPGRDAMGWEWKTGSWGGATMVRWKLRA